MHAMISSFIFFVFLAILSAQEPLYLQLQPTNQYISYGPTPPDAIRYQNTQTYDPSAQSYNQGQPLEDFSRIGLTRILITRVFPTQHDTHFILSISIEIR
ncbi:hypothetical protein QR680_019348 [Steinernema hermaphroditum]|uniref:Uncharacterized protein n=1 Tax=Steinernema hermaphroditum TaxID=289476 RepID=A0AA39GQ14_9BILA|nr:hypothetical protein QR680_019348 [Steinernema hermaphroditum]